MKTVGFSVNESLSEQALKKYEFLSSVINFFIVFCAVLASICFIRGYVFFSVVVEGSSMEDTLIGGDTLVVNKITKPERFSVVVVKSDTVDPSEPDEKMYIKRVIGLPGEWVWTENGVVCISYDGENVALRLDDEKYTKDLTFVGRYDYKSDIPKTKISQGSYFVLGDNRRVSRDSRSFGEVPEAGIVGVVPDYVIRNKDSSILQFFISLV